jgi:hypothetical protein
MNFVTDGRWEMEVGSWKLEVGRWELGDGRWELGLVSVLKDFGNLQI